jgi:hypothetical protein
MPNLERWGSTDTCPRFNGCRSEDRGRVHLQESGGGHPTRSIQAIGRSARVPPYNHKTPSDGDRCGGRRLPCLVTSKMRTCSVVKKTSSRLNGLARSTIGPPRRLAVEVSAIAAGLN